MSDTYTKLFASITASTIVSEPLATRWLWVTLLAMADAHGCVYGSIPGLARIANISVNECEAAIQCFLNPDPYSRTKEKDGRRAEVIDGGWVLLNHAKYAAIRGKEERRAYMREYMRKRRVNNVDPTLAELAELAPPTPTPTLDKKEQEQKKGASRLLILPACVPEKVWEDWHAYRSSGQRWTRKAKELSIAKLVQLIEQGQDPRAVVEQSIERGWTGLFPVHQQQQARAGPIPTIGKTAAAINTLEGMKRGNKRSDLGEDATLALPELGRAASG